MKRKRNIAVDHLLWKKRERRGSVEIPRCKSRRGSDYIVKTKQEGRLLGGD